MKINDSFATNFVKHFFEDFLVKRFGKKTKFFIPKMLWKGIGFLVAFLESFFGILVLFTKTERIGFLLLTLMHLLILLFFGPFGKNRYEGIYGFFILLFILFIFKKLFSYFTKGWNLLCIYLIFRIYFSIYIVGNNANQVSLFEVIVFSFHKDIFVLGLVSLFGILPIINKINNHTHFGEKFALKMHRYNFQKFYILVPKYFSYPRKLNYYLKREDQTHYRFLLTFFFFFKFLFFIFYNKIILGK